MDILYTSMKTSKISVIALTSLARSIILQLNSSSRLKKKIEITLPRVSSKSLNFQPSLEMLKVSKRGPWRLSKGLLTSLSLNSIHRFILSTRKCLILNSLREMQTCLRFLKSWTKRRLNSKSLKTDPKSTISGKRSFKLIQQFSRNSTHSVRIYSSVALCGAPSRSGRSSRKYGLRLSSTIFRLKKSPRKLITTQKSALGLKRISKIIPFREDLRTKFILSKELCLLWLLFVTMPLKNIIGKRLRIRSMLISTSQTQSSRFNL